MQLKAYRDAHIVENYCRKPEICGEKELKHNYLNKKGRNDTSREQRFFLAFGSRQMMQILIAF